MDPAALRAYALGMMIKQNKPGEQRGMDDTKSPPRHHKSHDEAMRTPPRQHKTHDAPMQPGRRPGC